MGHDSSKTENHEVSIDQTAAKFRDTTLDTPPVKYIYDLDIFGDTICYNLDILRY